MQDGQELASRGREAVLQRITSRPGLELDRQTKRHLGRERWLGSLLALQCRKDNVWHALATVLSHDWL